MIIYFLKRENFHRRKKWAGMIEYVRLFTLLRLRNMRPLVLHLIMNMYISHRMQVRFGTAWYEFIYTTEIHKVLL